MKPELILQADILDIIFEDRNKEYGAYNLRKEYNGRMTRAMLGVSAIVAIIFATSFANRSHDGETYSGHTVIIDSVVIAAPPISDPPTPIEPPKEKIATIKNPTFVLTNDSITDIIPTFEELNQDVVIGLKTGNGIAALSDVPPPQQYGNSADQIVDQKIEMAEQVLDRSEVMPEYPGGQAAFMRFLSKNLRVPENALEPGQQIKVIIRFVVGKDGELSNIEFLKISGEVFEQEVLRVMKKMPKWKPGIQNGVAVQVYFNLPIIFNAPEE